MGSNHQASSQMSEDVMQFLSDAISFEESCISENGCSSGGDSMNGQCPSENTNVVVQCNAEDPRISIQGMSFDGHSYVLDNSSNIPCTLARDHFPAQQQTFQVGQNYPELCGRQGNQLPYPMFALQMTLSAHQASIPPLMTLKKPKLEIPPIQNPMQLTTSDPNAAAMLYQQQLLQNQQQNQTPSRIPPYQMPGVDQKQSDAITAMNANACIRRLMCYMYHLRQRPADNSIGYWRKFVAEYYAPSPSSRRRWCLSKCDNVGGHAYGINSWKCDLCRSQAGKGFEATYEVLPRMFEVCFGSGVIDELLYLNVPVEKRHSSGVMVLCFEKAVQESVYKQLRVVHEGQLRIAFSPELKILSWEFCIQQHDEVVSRGWVAAQVNEVVEHAEKCQSNGELGESEEHDLLTNCTRVLTAGKKLATSLKLPLVNELGFPKPFVRFLQISEVLNCMKDLMTVSQQSNTSSPIEILKRYPQAVNVKLKENIASTSQMPQTPNTGSSFQWEPPNEALLNSQSYQKFLQQRVPSDSEYNSNSKPLLYALAKSSLGPSTSGQQPTVQQQEKDLLAHMPAVGSSGRCTKNARGKRKLVCDPNCKLTQAGVFIEENNMVESGKTVNHSSGRNSSVRIFTDNSMAKREPDSEEDSNSPNGLGGLTIIIDE